MEQGTWTTDNVFERMANAKIRKAMIDGEFDNLPLHGKPLDDYESMEPDIRLMKNAGLRPAFMDRRKQLAHEISEARKAIKAANKYDAQAILTTVNAKISAYNKGIPSGMPTVALLKLKKQS
jgi:hypothetical protein